MYLQRISDTQERLDEAQCLWENLDDSVAQKAGFLGAARKQNTVRRNVAALTGLKKDNPNSSNE